MPGGSVSSRIAVAGENAHQRNKAGFSARHERNEMDDENPYKAPQEQGTVRASKRLDHLLNFLIVVVIGLCGWFLLSLLPWRFLKPWQFLLACCVTWMYLTNRRLGWLGGVIAFVIVVAAAAYNVIRFRYLPWLPSLPN